MVDISENPVWTTVTRVERLDIALGGDEVNPPNKALKELTDRTAWLRKKVNELIGVLPPVVDNPIPDTTGLELQNPTQIDLNNVFSDPNGDPLTYLVTGNSDPTKIGTSISGGILTINFLEWDSDYGNQQIVTMEVLATDSGGLSVSDSFTITVDPLETLMAEPYYVFVQNGELEGDADIYVDATERDAIIADPNLNTYYSLGNSGNPVFNAIANTGVNIPQLALDNAVVIDVYRFRNINEPPYGSYLFAGPTEAVSVRLDPNFLEEGLAFYAFNTGKARQTDFKRYRYTGRRPEGDYCYALGLFTPGSGNTTLEGVICEIDVI